MRSWRSNTQHTSRSMLLGVTLIILAGPYSAEEVSSGSIAASLSSSSQKHVASPPGSEHPLHPGDISPVSSEWARFNENGCFYKIVSRPMLGWAAARESCARFANGADLASITDESELRFLANVAQGSNSSSGKAIPVRLSARKIFTILFRCFAIHTHFAHVISLSFFPPLASPSTPTF